MDWIDSAAERVIQLLERKPEDSADIHVWSDGSVTGPKDNDSRVGHLRLVSTFTPDERPTFDEVKRSITRGIQTSAKAEKDEQDARLIERQPPLSVQNEQHNSAGD